MKANFYIGLIFYKVQDYESSMNYFADIREELKEGNFKDLLARTEEKITKMMKRNAGKIIPDYFK